MRALAKIEPVVVPSLREAFAYSDATKAVVVADAADARALRRTAARSSGGRAYVTRSLPEFVEMLDPAVDKGEALGVRREAPGHTHGRDRRDRRFVERRAVAARGGFRRSRWVRRRPSCASIARAVVGDVAHDGVAEAIETVRAAARRASRPAARPASSARATASVLASARGHRHRRASQPARSSVAWPGFAPQRVAVTGNRLVPRSEYCARARVAAHVNMWLQNTGAMATRSRRYRTLRTSAVYRVAAGDTCYRRAGTRAVCGRSQRPASGGRRSRPARAQDAPETRRYRRSCWNPASRSIPARFSPSECRCVARRLRRDDRGARGAAGTLVRPIRRTGSDSARRRADSARRRCRPRQESSRW